MGTHDHLIGRLYLKQYFMVSPDISRTELSAIIDDWIFNERNRKIIKRRLLDGICFEPLAEEFDMSVRQIKNIVYKEQEKIFKHLV